MSGSEDLFDFEDSETQPPAVFEEDSQVLSELEDSEGQEYISLQSRDSPTQAPVAEPTHLTIDSFTLASTRERFDRKVDFAGFKPH